MNIFSKLFLRMFNAINNVLFFVLLFQVALAAFLFSLWAKVAMFLYAFLNYPMPKHYKEILIYLEKEAKKANKKNNKGVIVNGIK
jgi:hypothetical protein